MFQFPEDFVKLVEQIAEQEALYSEIQVHVATKHYAKRKNASGQFATLVTHTCDTSISRLGQTYDIRSSGTSTTGLNPGQSGGSAGSRKDFESRAIFDGSGYRAYRTEATAGEKDRTTGLKLFTGPRVSNLARPHMLLLHNCRPRPQKSQSLARHIVGEPPYGTSAVSSGLGSDFYERTTINGDAEFRGLRCVKVTINLGIPNYGRSGRHEIWLAKDRNLIPARILTFRYGDFPVTERTIENWIEIKDGVWFPKAAQISSFRSPATQALDPASIDSTISYEVQSVVFTKATFAKMNWPEGTAFRQFLRDLD